MEKNNHLTLEIKHSEYATPGWDEAQLVLVLNVESLFESYVIKGYGALVNDPQLITMNKRYLDDCREDARNIANALGMVLTESLT